MARRLVLVIDDDAELASMLSETIEGLGYRAAWVANGLEALAFLEAETQKPSLILVDLFMPLMGGIEFLRVVKSRSRLHGIPRVIMTAANDHMVGVKEDASVLYKPLDYEALTQLLTHYCHDGGGQGSLPGRPGSS